MPKRICGIDGCGKPHRARGWCTKHWKRWRVHGDPLYEHPPFEPKPCMIADCAEPHYARGWCREHYQRLRKTLAVCSIDGCGRGVMGNGLCATHYYRARRHGDPHYTEVPQRRAWTADERRRLEMILDSQPDGLGEAEDGEVIELATLLERSRGAVTAALNRLRRKCWERAKAEATA